LQTRPIEHEVDGDCGGRKQFIALFTSVILIKGEGSLFILQLNSIKIITDVRT